VIVVVSPQVQIDATKNSLGFCGSVVIFDAGGEIEVYYKLSIAKLFVALCMRTSGKCTVPM
jgi:hypothetical protein